MQKAVFSILIVYALMTQALGHAPNGGSKCPGTICASGPAGHKCYPKYERMNKCCPVWYCKDAYGALTTHYGISSSNGGAVVQSVSSQTGGNPPTAGLLQGLQNMFSNMFG